jgi:hypothetical protein
MFLWFPVLDLARAPRRTARKKGSGYENDLKRETKLEVKNYQSKNDLFHCILHDMHSARYIFCEISIINFPTNGIRLKLRNVFEIVFNRQTPQTSNR